MSNEDNNNFLDIAFFAHPSTWIHKIIIALNNEQKEKYKQTPLAEFARSITRKLSLLRMYADNTNIEMSEVNRLLRENRESVEHCLKERKAFIFKDINHIYCLLGYMESYITTMKSSLDLLEHYIVVLFRKVLGVRFKNTWNFLESKGIDLKWKKEILDKIRNDFIHHYAAWIGFKRENDTFVPTLILPTSLKKHKAYKKFPQEILDSDDINHLIDEFLKFFEETTDLLEIEIKAINRK